MARVLNGSHSFTCTPRITTPAFSLPVEAGPHLSTPEGWKAELALAMESNYNMPCSETNMANGIALHQSYLKWPKYKTAKQVLCTVHRTKKQKQLGRK